MYSLQKLSDPANGFEIWRLSLEEWEPREQRSISSDADAMAAMSSHGKQRSGP